MKGHFIHAIISAALFLAVAWDCAPGIADGVQGWPGRTNQSPAPHAAEQRRALPSMLDDGAAQAPDGPFKVVSWNIEQLGARNPPRTQEQLMAIAERILTFGAGVLALQEIEDVSALEDIRAQLGVSWRLYHAGMENALLYDEQKVEMLTVEILDALEDPPCTPYPGQDYSRPVSGVFRPVGTYAEPFRVIGIHCYYGDTGMRASEGSWLRTRVLELLRTPGEPRDIVVIGDFNGQPGSPPHPTLQEAGVLFLLAKENGDVTTTNGRKVDHCYVSQEVQDKLLKQSTFVFRPEHYGETTSYFRDTYSDHYPILVEFVPDARTDFLDFGSFALHWLEQECCLENQWCRGADLSADGEVMWGDLRTFAENWLGGIP